MKTKKKLLLFLFGIACLALVLAGCQKVGNVDLNRYLLSGLETKSLEGKGSIVLDVSDAKSGESHRIELNYSSLKIQDKERMSLAGELVFDGVTIPLKLQLNGYEYFIEIEGLLKPLHFGPTGLAEEPEGFDFDPAELQSLQQKLLPFIVEHLPNPKTIDVESVTETVNGETLRLAKVHAEIKASDLFELFFAFFDSALADEEGMKEAIRTVLEFAAEHNLGEVKPESSGLIYEVIKTMAKDLKQEFEQSITAEVQDVLNNPQNYLKMDLYLDDDLNLRKGETELSIAAKDFSIKLTSSSEMWNYGGDVTIDPIDTSNGVIELSDSMQELELLRAVDRDSELFRVLKDNFYKKDVTLSLKDDDEYRAFIDEKTEKGMAPVRFVSEQLDGHVQWIDETRQVVVTDFWSGRMIEMTIGSDTAVVDGQPMNMGAPAMLVDDTTFVPVRFIAEQFDAQVDWDEETNTVLISRE